MSEKIIVEKLVNLEKDTVIPALISLKKAQDLNLVYKKLGDMAIACRKLGYLFDLKDISLKDYAKTAYSDDTLITKVEASFADFSEEELFSESFENILEIQTKNENFEVELEVSRKIGGKRL